MAVAEARLLPVSPNARRKSDGTPYTPEDREAVSVITRWRGRGPPAG